MKHGRATVLVLLAALAVSCTTERPPTGKSAAGEGSARLTAEAIAETVKTSMDPTADPCEDFYRYACGGWIDSTELPADEQAWLRSFSEIAVKNRDVVHGLLEAVAEAPGDDPDEQRVGRFYGSCMDEEAVEGAGGAPLEPFFAEIATIDDVASLFRVTGKLHRYFVNVLFDPLVEPDPKDPSLSLIVYAQAELGMPDREYYVSGDENNRQLMADYEEHVAHVFGLLGEPESEARDHAAQVIALETELAESSIPLADTRDVEEMYNKIDVDGLKRLTPSLPWDEYLAATGFPDLVDISVATPEYFEAFEELVRETPMDVFRTYLRWFTVAKLAEDLSSAFVGAHFDFYDAKLGGQQEVETRWKRCVEATEGALGEAVAKIFVEKYFAGPSKQVAIEMHQDIAKAFEENLEGLAWMDPETRGLALEKLYAASAKIGYPEVWRDYSAMTVTPDDHFANVLAGREFEYERQIRKIGQPVDRNEWIAPAHTVNAYHHRLFNEIVFPAGVLQPPFFHRDFPAAMNYGGIGGVLGHEVTHAFDDQGRKFGPHGQLSEWWEPEVSDRFVKEAQCVEDLYSTYEPVPGAKVNGKLTLGESIADLGGIKQAHKAYGRWEERHGAPEPFIEGLTNEQLLFISWGQVWCAEMTEEYLRRMVIISVHAPPRYRAITPLAHYPAFAEAFSCEPGTPMNPREKCGVW